MSSGYTAETALQVAAEVAVAVPSAGGPVTPDDLRRFLARLRLLDGVPFAYLVPDSELLPPESIRFFYLDRGWTDALVEGALSVGTVTSTDRAELEAVYNHVRAEVDEEERQVRLPDGVSELGGPAGTVTGFLLRSRAVSGWPGLHVRGYRREPAAWDDELIPEELPDRLKVLRMERLAPAVLLVLFDGVPEVVHVEEPRSGIQFGVDLKPVDDRHDRYQAVVQPRNPRTAEDLGGDLNVPFRPDAPGVIDIRQLAADLGATRSDAFAVQMLRFPYRQVFGDPRRAVPWSLLDLFQPAVDLTLLELLYEEVIHP